MSQTLITSPNDTSIARLSRKVDRLIYASFVMAWAIFACSMVWFGLLSYWLSCIGLGFVLIHHPIVLAHRAKLRKLSLQPDPPSKLPIPVSSRMPMIIFAAFIGVIYLAAFAVVIFWLDCAIGRNCLETGWDNRFIATFIEVVLLGFQTPLMMYIALGSLKERQAVLGITGGARWYNLAQYRDQAQASK